MVHAYISLINPDIKLWLTEGMALYLANGEPFYRDWFSKKLLSIKSKELNPGYLIGWDFVGF
jgi:hypothetical protein